MKGVIKISDKPLKAEKLTPIFTAVSKYAEKNLASFHTPGHKGNAGILSGLDLLRHDLTELPETADLFEVSEQGGEKTVIEQSEEYAARNFGAYESFYSAQGCTLCIQTMLHLASRGGSHKKILTVRNAHKSVVNTAELLDLELVWVWPADQQVTPDEIEVALKKNDDISAVFVTSPDYYGRVADIEKISVLCKNAGVPLLVDNAHGSHLGAFGHHPLALGATMTADSLHKTLPVLTGGAVLHLSKEAYDKLSLNRRKVKGVMSVFASSSPSFNTLASIDLASDWWRRVGEKTFMLTSEVLEDLKKKSKKAGIAILEGAWFSDPTRLVIDAAEMAISGEDVAEFFRGHGCEPELFDEQYVVFIVTPFNTPKEINKLEDALVSFAIAANRGRFWRVRRVRSIEKEEEKPEFIPPHKRLGIKEAGLRPTDYVDVSLSLGKIAARTVCPCPPGIPIVVPGEEINDYVIHNLEKAGYKKIEVVVQ